MNPLALQAIIRPSRLAAALDCFLAPPICPVCRRNLSGDGEVCKECRKRLPWLPDKRCSSCGGAIDGILEICAHCAAMEDRPWYRGVSVFFYKDELRLAVHRFKYRGMTCLARFFGHQMAQAWLQRREWARPDLVTPVPLLWRRAWSRDYNPTQLLADFAAAELGQP